MTFAWRQVTRDRPCEACHKSDWCARAPDGAIVCERCPDPPAGYYVAKRRGAGAIFRPIGSGGGAQSVRDSGGAATRGNGHAGPARPATDWAREAEACRQRIEPARVDELVARLDVTPDSLRAVGVGWALADDLQRWRAGFAGDGPRPDGCFTFPERDGGGRVVGLSLRSPDGGKGFPAGAERGLVVPASLRTRPDPVLIVEGATDTAALDTLGVAAVGRPSNSGGAADLARLLDGRAVLVVGERDAKTSGAWPGRDGAKAVAQRLAAERGEPVAFALPPDGVKDVRAWLEARVASGLDLRDREACAAAGRELVAALQGAARKTKLRRENKCDMLIRFASDAEYFHSADAAYLSATVDGVCETFKLRSRAARLWLCRLAHENGGGAPSGEDMQSALNALESRALFDGPELPVGVRLAGHDGRTYLDLADDGWRVVEVDETGWRVIAAADCPVRFIRPRGVLPIPAPVDGGSVDELRALLNLPDDDGWALLLGWIVAALRAIGPYPILQVDGEQGSAKTFLCRLIRALLDPNTADLRSEPREVRDVAIAAQNSLIVGLDNLPTIQAWLSNCLCRLSTGGGFGVRELYSNSEEALFSAQRPVLLNGITQVLVSSDVRDRAINLSLPTIPECRRRLECDLWGAFHARQPAILGALLTAVSFGLRHVDSVVLPGYPRLADFARWAVACEPALGLPAGAFLAAYSRNRAASHEGAVDASPIGPLIVRLVEAAPWQGTARELLAELDSDRWSDERTRRSPEWPRTARKLSGDLRKLAPNLRAVGVELTCSRHAGGRRVIDLRKCGGDTVTTATPSQSGGCAGTPGDSGVTVPPSGPSPRPSPVSGSQAAQSGAFDGRDGSDGATPPLSVDDPGGDDPRSFEEKYGDFAEVEGGVEGGDEWTF